MQSTNEPKLIQGMIQKSVAQSVSSEVKQISAEKDTINESSSSRIWQEIASSKTKQIREIIQIGEERGQNNSYNSQNPSQQKVEKQDLLIRQTDLQKDQQIQGGPQKEAEIKPAESQSNAKANLSTQKQAPVEYHSGKQLFPNGKVDLGFVYGEKQSQRIFMLKKKELFGSELEERKDYYKQVQLEAIQWLLSCVQKKQAQKGNTLCNYNIIRTVDLLYKKYLTSPFKPSPQPQTSPTSSSQYMIYKPDPIYCQSFYSLADNSTSHQHHGIGDNFKRIAPGNHYNDKYVSLVDNESTNQNQDYLQTIASNYVNGIRMNKSYDANHSASQSMQKSTVSQGLDKFKKYGYPNSGISLPFDVELNSVSSKKQYNQQYSLFQSTDDDKSDRFNQERNVAKTFVKDGYGLQIVRNHLGPSMDGGTYNRAITTIIRDSYKKIEDFLTKSCNMKIHSLTSSEFSLVKTPLVHCRNILRPEDLNTFFKYIGITYKFGKLKNEEYPTPEQTLSLYNAILRGLNDRKNARDQTHRPNRNNRDPYYQ